MNIDDDDWMAILIPNEVWHRALAKLRHDDPGRVVAWPHKMRFYSILSYVGYRRKVWKSMT